MTNMLYVRDELIEHEMQRYGLKYDVYDVEVRCISNGEQYQTRYDTTDEESIEDLEYEFSQSNPACRMPVFYEVSPGKFLIICGRHRTTALRKRGETIIKAYVIKSSSDKELENKLKALSAQSNNGQKGEIREHRLRRAISDLKLCSGDTVAMLDDPRKRDLDNIARRHCLKPDVVRERYRAGVLRDRYKQTHPEATIEEHVKDGHMAVLWMSRKRRWIWDLVSLASRNSGMTVKQLYLLERSLRDKDTHEAIEAIKQYDVTNNSDDEADLWSASPTKQKTNKGSKTASARRVLVSLLQRANDILTPVRLLSDLGATKEDGKQLIRMARGINQSLYRLARNDE